MALVRSSHKLAPSWSTLSWLGELPGFGFAPKARAANGEIDTSSISRRYWVEGACARPLGCVRHRATRRIDDAPVWIVIPDDPHAHKLARAVPFLRAAKLARELRHPGVLRTLEVGVLDDARPFVVLERVPSESLAAWIGQRGPLRWSEVRPIALRLCSAVEIARQRDLAPRDLDLDGCLHLREGGDPFDVRLGELFVRSSARPVEQDAPAIAMIVHALLGGAGHVDAPIDNVLLRALGTNGYADVRELARAFAAVECEDDAEGVRESHGSNHAAVVGEFLVDVEAEEAMEAARPIPRWEGQAVPSAIAAE
ncbi:MAG: hypothetical protein IAG13_24265 [Deltaproteobacteria bacterium]|nr:hypothetical protein [Nannocystaceae bacterium]